MKKKILFLLILFMPFFINAEEKCEIISGNGKDIGSEIVCGTEHFYIIESNDETVKMLAKYNLDMGYEYNKVTVSEERYNEFVEICGGASYCDKLLNENEFEGYNNLESHFENSDGTHSIVVYREIESEMIIQNEKAIGAHGDEKGNPEFPEYGVVSYLNISSEEFDGESYANNMFTDHLFSNFDYYISGSSSEIFENYQNYLMENDVNVKSVNILSVRDIDNIIYNITTRHLPLNDWGIKENWIIVNSIIKRNYSYYLVGSIKEFLPSGYEWLYSTTYWTRTFYGGDPNYLFFVDSLGNLCNSNACHDAIGAGIRPVVEIGKDSINYNLVTESEEGGTLEKVNETKVGDTIVLKPLAKAGYKLKGFTITTDSGQTIEIEEKDIFKNDDGTIIINPDVFVMPLENVIITARWGFTNPKTGVFDYISFIMVGLIISFIGYVSISYNNQKFEL